MYALWKVEKRNQLAAWKAHCLRIGNFLPSRNTRRERTVFISH